ncbi:hypothetical protein B0H13DRAFT_2344320 [Mycena leptocephala]|nr:hypothetical protein B0H13DRAFT_2344320 [Mycena leptocephala]
MKLTIATLISFVAMVLAMPTEFSGQKRDIFERGSMATCSCGGFQTPNCIPAFPASSGSPN